MVNNIGNANPDEKINDLEMGFDNLGRVKDETVQDLYKTAKLPKIELPRLNINERISSAVQSIRAVPNKLSVKLSALQKTNTLEPKTLKHQSMSSKEAVGVTFNPNVQVFDPDAGTSVTGLNPPGSEKMESQKFNAQYEADDSYDDLRRGAVVDRSGFDVMDNEVDSDDESL